MMRADVVSSPIFIQIYDFAIFTVFVEYCNDVLIIKCVFSKSTL